MFRSYRLPVRAVWLLSKLISTPPCVVSVLNHRLRVNVCGLVMNNEVLMNPPTPSKLNACPTSPFVYVTPHCRVPLFVLSLSTALPWPCHQLTRPVGGGTHPAVWGSTVTVKLQVLVFPKESVTVLVTEVVPKGNSVPEGGAEVSVKLVEQLSQTFTEKGTSRLLLDVVARILLGQSRVMLQPNETSTPMP